MFQSYREINGFQIIFNSAHKKKKSFIIVLKGFILRKLGVLECFGYL